MFFLYVYISLRVKSWRLTLNCGSMNDCAIKLSSEDDKWLNFNN